MTATRARSRSNARGAFHNTKNECASHLKIERKCDSRRNASHFIIRPLYLTRLYYCDQKIMWQCIYFENSLFILANQFHRLQSNPLPMQCTYANGFSNLRNSWKSRFQGWPSAPSSQRLESALSSQNGVPGAVFWACWTARSRTVPNQVNTVVVERYESSFWRKNHEESTLKIPQIVVHSFCNLLLLNGLSDRDTAFTSC